MWIINVTPRLGFSIYMVLAKVSFDLGSTGIMFSFGKENKIQSRNWKTDSKC